MHNKTLKISQISLGLLILTINVNAPNLFMAKELFFIVTFLLSAQYIDFRQIKYLLLALLIYITSFLFNFFDPPARLSFEDGIANMLGLFYLGLLMFNKNCYAKTIVKSYLLSALTTSMIIIIVWMLCYYSSEIKDEIFLYSANFETDKIAFLFMIRDRKILDWWLPSVYYGTAPCIVPAVGYCFAQLLNQNSRKTILFIVVFLIAIIFTGSRANMLSCLSLFLLFVSAKLYLSKNRILSYVFVILTAVVAIFLAIAFLGDVEESSLEVKTLHLNSYYNIFDSDYLRTLFFGWGGGSVFYTEGYDDYVTLTELSIQETVRRYGLLSTVLIFAYIWFSPIWKLFKNSVNPATIFMSLSLLAYIFVASTNPFLIGSIGFTALLFFSVAIERWPCLVYDEAI